MPARRAFAPRRIPFHLALFAGWRFAPDREVGLMALAIHLLDPAFAFIGGGASQTAIIRNG